MRQSLVAILIAFLLLSVLIAGCMQMTLTQMQEEKLQKIEQQEAQRRMDQLKKEDDQQPNAPRAQLLFQEVDVNNLNE